MYGDSKKILISYIEDHVSACFLSNTITEGGVWSCIFICSFQGKGILKNGISQITALLPSSMKKTAGWWKEGTGFSGDPSLSDFNSLWFGVFYHWLEWNQDFAQHYPSKRDPQLSVGKGKFSIRDNRSLSVSNSCWLQNWTQVESFAPPNFINNTTKAKQKNLYNSLLDKISFHCLVLGAFLTVFYRDHT